MRRSIVVTCFDTILIVFILSLILSAALQRIGGQAWGWVGIHGESMHPTVANGSLVLSVPADPDDLSAGDIVVYRSGGLPGLVCHRIVGVAEDGGFLTQGDGTAKVDQELGLPPVTAETLAGYVPQLAGRPVAIPLLGKLTAGGASDAGPNLMVALGVSMSFLALGGKPKRARRRK